MVEVQILDESTVQVGGQTVAGPAHVWGPSCSVSGNTWTQGYVLVQAGSGTQQLWLTVRQTEILPFSICFVFLLGLLWARFGLVR